MKIQAPPFLKKWFISLYLSNLLHLHQLIKLHVFRVYNFIILHLYLVLCVRHPKSCLLKKCLSRAYSQPPYLKDQLFTKGLQVNALGLVGMIGFPLQHSSTPAQWFMLFPKNFGREKTTSLLVWCLEKSLPAALGCIHNKGSLPRRFTLRNSFIYDRRYGWEAGWVGVGKR